MLSPLSLALQSLIRDERLSRLLTPLSESSERLPTGEPLTAFLRWSATDAAEAVEDECACEGEGELEPLPFPRFDGERVKRGSHEWPWLSASEPSVDVDQRERSVRSCASAPSSRALGERRIGAGLGLGLSDRASSRRSTSKSKEESGEAGADACEYTLALCGVLGHCGSSDAASSVLIPVLSSSRKSTSAGTDERGGGRDTKKEKQKKR